ncbi:serine-rich coiled-coil domain-containing protein 2 isoform X2 [Oncorhynchus tshawytscha]|uniref:serine-rich coiled-coil domain-containing protein 2 isoform X2 n=1 Tax=Oncorhynchus tshawytscha TaxID=74940 RepID=UPI000D0A249B|nr:serine-rich coiled-coil domain-containing protein 2 isoform X2 [Oncorhynchus tshawytscha]
MSHFERSERGGRQGHWRRRQHHWNGPDHFHNDTRDPVFQQYDGYAGPVGFRVGPRPFPPVGRHNGHTRALDELTLKHMAQDCSSVKNQLLTLKSLLQMEDGGPEVVEGGEEDNSMTLQLEELMKEVWKLREELRNKERSIAQLTLQQQQLQQQGPAHAAQSGRGHCHQRTQSLGGDRRTHHDKATQTSWRGQGHSQAGLLPTPFFSPGQGLPRTSMPQRRQTTNTAFQPQPPRAPHPRKTSKNSPHRGPQ